MKKHINLFPKNYKLKQFIITVDRVIWQGTLLITIIIVIAGYFIYTGMQIEKDTKKLKKQLESMQNLIINEKDFREKFKEFASKQAALKVFLSEDKDMAIYYKIIETNVSKIDVPIVQNKFSTDSAAIANQPMSKPAKINYFLIDEGLNFNFTISLANEAALLQLLRNFEDKSFLDEFKSLSLESIYLNREDSKNSQINLSFTGVFKDPKQKKTADNGSEAKDSENLSGS